VDTDFSSVPTQINNPGQIVGASCDNMGNCRAFLRQNKVMMDLNSLIPANSPLYLMFAFGLNDAGEIVGMALQTSTGDVHGFLATPTAAPAVGKAVSASPMVLPENARQLLLQRFGMRRR
jgi:probable HAF family extracellular repeat protein